MALFGEIEIQLTSKSKYVRAASKKDSGYIGLFHKAKSSIESDGLRIGCFVLIL